MGESKIYEVRAESADDNRVYALGARRTRQEAEALLAERERDRPSAAQNDRYWVEEIDTTGLYKIPPWPPPRKRYSTRATGDYTGYPSKIHVEILDGERVVAGYDRNYSMLDTFEPFRQGDRDFALISPDYTATSVIDLASGEIVAAEEPNAAGFCPVGFYVPDWWDVHPSEPPYVRPGHAPDEPVQLPGSVYWSEDSEWPTGDFGFVWGCVWGDDSTWKVQYLDFSEIQSGVLRRDVLATSSSQRTRS